MKCPKCGKPFPAMKHSGDGHFFVKCSGCGFKKGVVINPAKVSYEIRGDKEAVKS